MVTLHDHCSVSKGGTKMSRRAEVEAAMRNGEVSLRGELFLIFPAGV